MAWGCAASVGRMNEDMKTQQPDADAAHKKIQHTNLFIDLTDGLLIDFRVSSLFGKYKKFNQQLQFVNLIGLNINDNDDSVLLLKLQG